MLIYYSRSWGSKSHVNAPQMYAYSHCPTGWSYCAEPATGHRSLGHSLRVPRLYQIVRLCHWIVHAICTHKPHEPVDWVKRQLGWHVSPDQLYSGTGQWVPYCLCMDTMSQCNYSSLRRAIFMLRTGWVTPSCKYDGVVWCWARVVWIGAVQGNPANDCESARALRVRQAVETSNKLPLHISITSSNVITCIVSFSLSGLKWTQVILVVQY